MADKFSYETILYEINIVNMTLSSCVLYYNVYISGVVQRNRSGKGRRNLSEGSCSLPQSFEPGPGNSGGEASVGPVRPQRNGGAGLLRICGSSCHLHTLLHIIIRSIQDIMEQLESVGWVRVEKRQSAEITQLDVDEIFKMIDVDKSGAISRSVSRIV